MFSGAGRHRFNIYINWVPFAFLFYESLLIIIIGSYYVFSLNSFTKATKHNNIILNVSKLLTRFLLKQIIDCK